MTHLPIEFVYFDLGNVLASFDIDRACNNVALRWNVDATDVRTALWSSGLQSRFEQGLETDQSMAAIACEQLGLSPDQVQAAELLDLLCDMFEPIDEMADVVQRVRDAGTRIGLLSNTCVTHWQWLLKAEYRALQIPMDAIVLSYEVGSMKPAPAIYENAERQAGVPPGTILFLDDRIENVQAAIDRGWNAHQFTDCTSAIEVLRTLQVLGPN